MELLESTSREQVTYDETTLSPYGPNVLVRRLLEETSSGGGILLPENALNKNLFCEVLKVGHGEYIGGKLIPPPCAPGDIVVVRQMDGRKVSSVNRNLVFVHQELIEGIAKKESWPESVRDLIAARKAKRLGV